MSPGRAAHDAPARRRRPAPTHERDRGGSRDRPEGDPPPEQEPATDEDAEPDEPDEPGEPEEPDEPEDDELAESEAEESEADELEEPDDEEPDDEEPDDEEPDDEEPDDEEPDEPDETEEAEEAEESTRPARPEPSPGDRIGALDAARRAVEQLEELSHHEPEGVVGVERTEDGWTVTVEVLEDAHVPSTADVLAEYEVRLDAGGGLLGVTRGQRYVRGRTER